MSRRPQTDKAEKPQTREDRLKSALKANLAKRKAQASARGSKDTNEKAG